MKAALLMALAMLAPVDRLRAQAAMPASPPRAFAAPDRSKAVECLASAIVHEAGREPIEGQQAVAQVVMNRLRTPGYPKTVCGVVFQGAERRTGCQFTFTCDGSLGHKAAHPLTDRALGVARSALDDTLPDRVGAATHYHAYYVAPGWATRLERVSRIGAHIFYRSGQRSLPPGRIAAAESGAIVAAAAPAPAAEARPFSPWGLPLGN